MAKKTKKIVAKKTVSGKRDRANQNKQLRESKNKAAKDEVSKHRTVVLVAFRADVDVLKIKQRIFKACGSDEVAVAHKPQTIKHQGYTLTLIDSARQTIAAMDCGKVADILLACMPAVATIEEPAFDDMGYEMLSMIKLQGLPTVLGVADTQHKTVERYFTSEFTKDDKIYTNFSTLLRQITCCNPKVLNWRKERGYMVVDRAEHNGNQLAVCGWVRGDGFNCKHLVHITGHGDFQVDKIVLESGLVMDTAENHPERNTLEPLQEYDPTAQEQTWPTEEELQEATTVKMRMPKVVGNSQYDIAWFGTQVDGEEADREMEVIQEIEDDFQPESDAGSDFGDLELPEEMPEPPRQPAFTFEERAAEDLEFPDEVDTPMDTAARTRFQKYRGLQNFRSATWDAYEELPLSYSRIYEFQQFQAASKQFKKEFFETSEYVGGTGTTGKYVCLYITCPAPPAQPESIPMVVSTLFPHERKVTVMHANMHRCGEDQAPIKSKDEVEMHCGFRRFVTGPIYSEQPKKSITDNKRRMMRYFQPSSAACASFYAPAMLSPCPTLMFHNGSLVAWGSLDGSDTLRCIIKRIVLTGYPYRVHKNKAVVRHMFWNPHDIKYFKPLELRTKHGLRGHISESLGTHGYMKCKFNNRIKHDDTICIDLYKRVYPRWNSLAWGRAGQQPDDE